MERLRELEFAVLLDSAPDAIVIMDASGAIIFVNGQTERLFGHPRAELLGRSADALLAARFRGRDAFREAARAHDTPPRPAGAVSEIFGLRGDGREFPIEIRLAPIVTSQTTFGYAAIRDVSDRHHAEAELGRLRRQQEMLLTSVAEGVIGLDEKGAITYVNASAAKLLGYRPEDMIGKEEHALFHAKRADGSDHPEGSCPIQRAFHDGTVHHATGEVFWKRTGGSLAVNYTCAPIREDGRIIGASVIFADVTERKSALREAHVARPLARRIVQDLVEHGAVSHQVLTQVGRRLAADTPAEGIEDHLDRYRDMGLGRIEVVKKEGGRYSFSGMDLLERRSESRVATCSFTLGYLSEAVSRLHGGEPTLGTEIDCQSRGASRCGFVVQVKKPDEGLARRVKELI